MTEKESWIRREINKCPNYMLWTILVPLCIVFFQGWRNLSQCIFSLIFGIN